jgi:two-component system, sporulation sensor kinase E
MSEKGLWTLERFDLDSDAGRARLVQLHRYAQVGKCVNGVTHDINNLLGAAMAYAELATLDENIAPDTVKMLNQIVDGVTRCSTLVKSLTSIARKDRPDVNLACVDRVLDEILLLRDYEFKVNQITITRHFEPVIPTVPVDLPKLKLALVFLLMNAQEAVLDKDQRAISVRVGREGDGVFVAIADSGEGLSPELVDSAFEPLTTYWPSGDHLGMGLYVARQVAELHGGTLTYDPESGFRMTLRFDNGLRDRV